MAIGSAEAALPTAAAATAAAAAAATAAATAPPHHLIRRMPSSCRSTTGRLRLPASTPSGSYITLTIPTTPYASIPGAVVSFNNTVIFKSGILPFL